MDEKLASNGAHGHSVPNGHYATDYANQWEEIRTSNPQGIVSSRNGVDVAQAEEDFFELDREFSRVASRASKPTAITDDVEKAESSADSERSWDLETTLRGNRTAEEEAGIKDKHIGMCPEFNKGTINLIHY